MNKNLLVSSMKIYGWLFLLSVNVAQAMTGLSGLNEVRQQAGMTQLYPNKVLQQAAKNHANYLAKHQASRGFVSAHDEVNHLSGYTGETPSERAQFAGYEHDVVRENVSIGDITQQDALDGLMGAIYHRFTFLDFSIDQVGIGSVDEAFVYEMGRSDLVNICRYRPEEAILQSLITCGDVVVTKAFYQGLCRDLPTKALYQSPWKYQCPNRRKLNADYMAEFCQNPDPEALFETRGRYYTLCDQGIQVKAAWFDRLCEHPPADAYYRPGDRYYELCGTRVRSQWLESQCAASPADSNAGYYRDLCGSGDKVRADYIDQKTAEQQRKNPDIVYWPAPNARQVPPAFFEEHPDPLPDYEVSGYPISVQVNPQLGERVFLISLKLYRMGGKNKAIPIKDVRLLDAQTDPNENFSAYEYALMPLSRLYWGTRYRVESSVSVDGEIYTKHWTFKTQDLGLRTVMLQKRGEIHQIALNEEILLYRPPTVSVKQTFKGISARFNAEMSVEFHPVDLNSARFTVKGRGCHPVKLQFKDGFRSVFNVTGCE